MKDFGFLIFDWWLQSIGFGLRPYFFWELGNEHWESHPLNFTVLTFSPEQCSSPLFTQPVLQHL